MSTQNIPHSQRRSTVMDNLEFNYLKYFERDLMFVRYLGMWIPTDEEKHRYFRYVQWFVMAALTMLPNSVAQIAACIKNSRDLKGFIGSIYMTFITCSATLKSFLVFRNRRALATAFGWLEDETFQPKDLEQMKLAEAAMKFHRMAKTWLVGICAAAVFLLLISPLLDKQGESNLPFPAVAPFDYSYSPLYEIVYVFQGVSIICQATVNLYCEIIFTAFTTFVGVQCEFICHDLDNVEVLQAEDAERIVEHHRRTVLFSKNFDGVFSMIYFIQFASITLAMCMSMFVLTAVENQDYISLFLVIFQCTLFSIILFPCWFASEMQRKSEKIPQAAFCCSWVGASKSVRKDLICFIANTQKPLKLYAIDFFDISINSFIQILKTAFSYYTVLCNVNKKI